MGRPLSPPRIPQKSFECWATSTKQLLNAGKGHQVPRKAAHSFQKEVEQNAKDRERKDLGMETCPGEGVMKEEKFPHIRNPVHRRVCGDFWNLRGQHNWGKKKNKQTQNMCLTSTANGEVAQKLTTATSERGLGREVQAASSDLRVRSWMPWMPWEQYEGANMR